MLTVKTKIKDSKINGIGLFADQFIPRGSITWRFDPKFDIYFDPAEVEKMTQQQRELVVHFAYLSKKSGKYVYSIDDTRFTNHSSDPNIDNTQVLEGDIEVCGIAKKDINIGDEITIDYCLIDSGDENSSEEYLKFR